MDSLHDKWWMRWRYCKFLMTAGLFCTESPAGSHPAVELSFCWLWCIPLNTRIRKEPLNSSGRQEGRGWSPAIRESACSSPQTNTPGRWRWHDTPRNSEVIHKSYINTHFHHHHLWSVCANVQCDLDLEDLKGPLQDTQLMRRGTKVSGNSVILTWSI